MTNRIINVGEGIAIVGVMIGVGWTQNYWLLFFMIIPICTWAYAQDKLRNEFNEFARQREKLELEKLKEELCLLKLKKK